MKKPEKKPSVKTAMRIPAELHAELQEAAERAGHSMNDEIIERLAAGSGGATLRDVLEQGARTQNMVKQIIDAISATRR